MLSHLLTLIAVAVLAFGPRLGMSPRAVTATLVVLLGIALALVVIALSDHSNVERLT